MEYLTHCDRLEREGARFVELSATASLDAAVPSCPGWKVSDLLAHLGFVHRRAQYWVRVRATERISPKVMDLSRGPVGAPWMAEGIEELVATLRSSDPDDAMWAWGEDQHVRYWARRLLHETLVHRVDLEMALGVVSEVDPEVGADAIDEFFANLEYARDFSPAVENLVGDGDVIAFASDDGPTWHVRLLPTGFDFLDGPVDAHAQLSGTTSELLLVIYRRRALEDSSCRVEGRRELVERWLANSALL